MKLTIKLTLLLLVILLIVFLIIKGHDFVMQRVYQLEYTEYVEKYSKEENVDSKLIYAIIKSESNFKNNITSGSGAIGLMQLMESTAKEMAGKLDIDFPTKEILYDPETNIKIGIKYFAHLLNQYNGNTNLALAAYKAGIGNVSKWIENGTIKEDGSDIENIPFKETNNYVRKIIRDYKIYQKIYK